MWVSLHAASLCGWAALTCISIFIAFSPCIACLVYWWPVYGIIDNEIVNLHETVGLRNSAWVMKSKMLMTPGVWSRDLNLAGSERNEYLLGDLAACSSRSQQYIVYWTHYRVLWALISLQFHIILSNTLNKLSVLFTMSSSGRFTRTPPSQLNPANPNPPELARLELGKYV